MVVVNIFNLRYALINGWMRTLAGTQCHPLVELVKTTVVRFWLCLPMTVNERCRAAVRHCNCKSTWKMQSLLQGRGGTRVATHSGTNARDRRNICVALIAFTVLLTEGFHRDYTADDYIIYRWKRIQNTAIDAQMRPARQTTPNLSVWN